MTCIPWHNYEDDEMLDKAATLLQKGGCSGPTIDFLEQLVWHGFSLIDESAYFEHRRLREIIQLHQ